MPVLLILQCPNSWAVYLELVPVVERSCCHTWASASICEGTSGFVLHAQSSSGRRSCVQGSKQRVLSGTHGNVGLPNWALYALVKSRGLPAVFSQVSSKHPVTIYSLSCYHQGQALPTLWNRNQ